MGPGGLRAGVDVSMARARCVSFTPGTACGGQLSSDEAAERALLTTRRELKRSAPASALARKARLLRLVRQSSCPPPACVRVSAHRVTPRAAASSKGWRMQRRLRATPGFQGWDAAQKARLRRAAWRRNALRLALCAAALIAALSGCLAPRGPSAVPGDLAKSLVSPPAAPAPAADPASPALSLAQARHRGEQRRADALAADLQARLGAAEASLQQHRAASRGRVVAAEAAAAAAEARFSDLVRRLRAAEAAAAQAAGALRRERAARDRVRAAAEAEAATPEGALSAATLVLTVAALVATSCVAFRRSLVGAGERNRQVPTRWFHRKPGAGPGVAGANCCA